MDTLERIRSFYFILFYFFRGHATSTKRHVFHFSQEKPIHRISTLIIVTASLCYSTHSNTIYNNNNNNLLLLLLFSIFCKSGEFSCKIKAPYEYTRKFLPLL